MTETFTADHEGHGDSAPGDERLDGSGVAQGLLGYVLGLVLAAGLTAAAFYAVTAHLIWAPGIPAALVTLAVAQMGVHLVFFLHITSAPDQTNNFLALAFGVFVVALVVFGSLIIMANLSSYMMPTDKLIQMQR